MALYLVESVLPADKRQRAPFEGALAILEEAAPALELSLVEVQVASDFTRAFFVLEGPAQSAVREAFQRAALPVTLVKPVRLVGASLEQVRQDRGRVRYLVEWNLPEGLTMEAYLERKQKNSVHYAEVPEVTFQRTYVCEDMTKCLCLYDGPDIAAIYKARNAVGAPVDAITETAPVTEASPR